MTSGTQSALATFENIEAGSTATIRRTITEQDVNDFAKLSGDDNPLHMNREFARGAGFQHRVVHGMLVASYVSTLIGTQLPGTGSLWMSQSFSWKQPVFIGDSLEIGLTVVQKSAGSRVVVLKVKATNQHGVVVLEGEGSVKMPEFREIERTIPLSERVAFVNGTSGLGGAIAAALERQGVRVATNFPYESSNGALSLTADTRDSSQAVSAYDTARRQFGVPVTLVVNSPDAAYAKHPFDDGGWTGYQDLIDIHVRSVFNCCAAAVAGMREQRGGVIINIGSLINWTVPAAQTAPVAVAAAALKALTKSLAVELGPAGIRVNMISPGSGAAGPAAGGSDRLRKVEAMHVPLRRLCTPEDVADAVVFLAGDSGRFITGTDLPVCGGLAM